MQVGCALFHARGTESRIRATTENDGNEQRSVFFIAHPAFVAPLHALRILKHQYDEAFLIEHVEWRVDTQARQASFIIVFCKLSSQNLFSILHLLNDWLNNEHVLFDDNILSNMREFLASVNVLESEELDELVLQILQGIREKVCTHVLP